MRFLAPLLTACLLAGPALAEPYWSQIAFSTTASNAPAVVAAADAFMNSELGKTFPGRLMLLAAGAGNTSQTGTHTFVPIYKNAADSDAFLASMQGNAAWTKFQGEMERLTTPVRSVVYRNAKRWGDVNDTDSVWRTHAFDVSDPAKFLAAVDAFLASPTGQKFPGQVYLSAVVAGGMSPVSHVISVGYASRAEMADWYTLRDASADWATYNEAAAPVSTYLGATLAGGVKNWGATLSDVTAP